MRKLVLVILVLGVFLFLFELHARAGPGGKVAFEYDTMSGEAVATVDLHYDFDIVVAGIEMITDVRQIGLKDDWMPAGEPRSQFYRGYIEYRLNDSITLKLSNQCNHHFSLTNINSNKDTAEIIISAEYEF